MRSTSLFLMLGALVESDALPAPFVCGGQPSRETCSCTGKVYFGARFVSGLPGSGDEVTFTQLLAAPHLTKTVTGSIPCTSAAFGSDPAAGRYKECFCVPSTAPSPAPGGGGPIQNVVVMMVRAHSQTSSHPSCCRSLSACALTPPAPFIYLPAAGKSRVRPLAGVLRQNCGHAC